MWSPTANDGELDLEAGPHTPLQVQVEVIVGSTSEG